MNAYRQLSEAAKGVDRLVKISASTLAAILDHSTLSEESKQLVIDQVIKQIVEEETE